MKILRVSLVLMILAASMAPLAFANEKSKDAQTATDAGGAAKAIVVEVWAIASRSASDGEDDAIPLDAARRDSVLPELDSREEVDAWIHELAEQKRLLASQHFLLATSTGYKAAAKIGADVPRVIAVALTELGRTNSIQMHSVGTLLEITPHFDSGNAIYLELSFAITELRKSADVAIVESKDGERLAADVVNVLNFESTVRVGNGDVVTAYRTNMDSSSSGESYVILVSARIAPDDVNQADTDQVDVER